MPRATSRPAAPQILPWLGRPFMTHGRMGAALATKTDEKIYLFFFIFKSVASKRSITNRIQTKMKCQKMFTIVYFITHSFLSSSCVTCLLLFLFYFSFHSFRNTYYIIYYVAPRVMSIYFAVYGEFKVE